VAGNVDIVRVMYDSFSEGDIPKALSVVDPKVEWVEKFPYPGTYVGPDALRAVFEKVVREFDRYEMTFDRFIESNDVVVVIGDYRVHKKDADRDVESRFVHAFWIDHGKVIRYEQFLDTYAAHQVIGRLSM
jgi:ketosteroid isomerase-like protein